MSKLEQRVAELEKGKNLKFLDQLAVWWTGANNFERVLIIVAMFGIIFGVAVGLAFGVQALGVQGTWVGVITGAVVIPGIYLLIRFLQKIF